MIEKKNKNNYDPKFNEDQVFQIRRGLTLGLDVSTYADPKFNYCQMYLYVKD